jgi:hypothetical protein
VFPREINFHFPEQVPYEDSPGGGMVPIAFTVWLTPVENRPVEPGTGSKRNPLQGPLENDTVESVVSVTFLDLR